jgi:hypothetical protein
VVYDCDELYALAKAESSSGKESDGNEHKLPKPYYTPTSKLDPTLVFESRFLPVFSSVHCAAPVRTLRFYHLNVTDNIPSRKY